MNPKLSILICSLECRAVSFFKVLSSIWGQIHDPEEVQILFEVDDGTLPIGAKRNKLITRARGDYLCFVDDDDEISSNYVTQILEAIVSEPDCVGIKLKYFRDDVCQGVAHHSKIYDTWRTKQLGTGSYFYERTPNHINPIKSSIAKCIKFPDVDFGEDREWSLRIYPLLKTHVEIEEIIYFYKFNSKK